MGFDLQISSLDWEIRVQVARALSLQVRHRRVITRALAATLSPNAAAVRVNTATLNVVAALVHFIIDIKMLLFCILSE